MTLNIKCLLISGVTLLAACQTGRHTDDPELLKQVLTDYFHGIEQKDMVRMKALTTDDFVLYEDGSAWNNDSAFKNIRRHIPFQVKYRLGDMRFNVDDRSGDVVYTNHADFVFQDTIKESLDWLESATFRKTDAGWKMSFLHLTVRAPRYDTLRYLRQHYADRIKLFSSEPLKTGGLLFLGNSITEFGDWKKLTGDSTAVNRGIAADNTFGVLDRLQEVTTRQPRKLFLEIGINDISQKIPACVTEDNIYSIISKIRAASPATTVYVVSILPTNELARQDYPELVGTNGIVEQLDYNLRRNAAGKGFIYVDLKQLFSDKNGDLDRRYGQPDGLHPNAEGYRVWIKLLKEKKYL